MNHLDTFSGIGSWALAAKWMGWNTLAFVEKEPFCQQVLKKNFNGAPIHDDIFTFSAQPFRGRVDILTGSTPCQPFSQAGKREGSNDARHLFPEFLRVVAECEPEWVIIENVYGLLNIEGGQVFEAYNTSLESEGYSVQTICIPASALNAPHRRDRLWIVAHSNSIRTRTGLGEVQETDGEVPQWDNDAESRNSDSELRDGFDTDFGIKPIETQASQRQESSQERYDLWDVDTTVSGTDITADPDNAGIRTSPSEPHAKRPPFSGERGKPQSESSGYGGDVANTRCEYGQSRRDDRMDADSSKRSYSESDAERCDNTSTDEAVADAQNENERLSCGAAPQDARFRSDSGNGFRGNAEWGLNWRDVALATCVRGMANGDAVGLDGFKLTASKHREARLKALGNGIVPQIAYEIFCAIKSVSNADIIPAQRM